MIEKGKTFIINFIGDNLINLYAKNKFIAKPSNRTRVRVQYNASKLTFADIYTAGINTIKCKN